MKNYYALLGIDTSATKADVKKNYRLLATKFHPDKNSDPDAPSKFIEITEAYNILSDKKSRAKYDLARWQLLKEEKKSKESEHTFTAVVPPRVSLRTRRNKAQQKRGIAYFQIKSSFQKTLQLGVESIRITSRYIVRLLGIALFGVILNSVVTEIPNSFEQNIISGIFNCAIAVAVVYVIFKIAQNAFVDFKKDIRAFSVFYRLTHQKAAFISISGLVLVVLILGAILSRY